MSIYDRMQGTASRLFSRFQQGEVQYIQPGTTSGDPWDPDPGDDTPYLLAATVTGVDKELVDGSSILATDLEVRCADFGAFPAADGRIKIDGKECEIVRIIPIPAAGTVVAWRFVVRA